MSQNEHFEAEGRPATQRKGILLIEDDEQVHGFATMFLQKSGYTVFHASSFDEAVAVWQQNAVAIDLLFTGVGADGTRLASALLGFSPWLKVLFTSGTADATVATLCAQNPSCRFIQKPYFPEELTEAVSEMMAG